MQNENCGLLGKSVAYLQLYESPICCAWDDLCRRCGKIGFNYLAIPPPFLPGPKKDPFLVGSIDIAHPLLAALAGRARSVKTVDVVEMLCQACTAHGLGILLDIVIDRADARGPLVAEYSDLFDEANAECLDPKSLQAGTGAAVPRFKESDHLKRLLALWAGSLGALLSVGVSGFRFLNPGCIAPQTWRLLNSMLRRAFPGMISFAYTPGLSWQAIDRLCGSGFDSGFSSLPWWDRSASWLSDEFNLLRRVGCVVASPHALPPSRPAHPAPGAPRLSIAAAIGDCLLVPFDPVHDNEPELRTTIEQFNLIQSFGTRSEMRALSRAGDASTALVRDYLPVKSETREALITLISKNVSGAKTEVASGAFAAISGAAVNLLRISGEGDPLARVEQGEVRVVKVERTVSLPVPAQSFGKTHESLEAAMAAPRIAIESIEPSVDGGLFSARYAIDEPVAVSADIFSDGHPAIGAQLRWRHFADEAWHSAPLRFAQNDRWHGTFRPRRLGVHQYVIEAWIDEFASIFRDITIKHDAGRDIALDLAEATALLKSASVAAEPGIKSKLLALNERLATASAAAALELLADDSVRSLIERAQPRRFLSRSQPFRIDVEREKAAFAAWYELFPRSASSFPGRHGTFDDVIARLPDIRAMGFDVLYLPPIHPIGRTNRKGKNNRLTSAAEDPGSPYAIGAEEGGHDALHPELGSFEDFARLIAAATAQGLEIALDFAVQCSPDHPWLRDHPEWFRWRADGSLRFAENPPKKYEDIVNVEFYAEDGAAALWTALRDIVAFWIEHGVRIFRVDNPHTKPLPFWQWLIADIRARHPDVIFLSEAFTRPKMMYRLAKIGFSQSYSYFTWRNTKREITDYVTELTSPPAVYFFRPHFFVNTPDINPYFLQQSGRAGFLIRAVLAATLSGLWGVYSGFELCEAAALPGREEYLDSEKYEIKTRDLNAPGNIKAEIAALNRIRAANGDLHTHRGVKFYNAFNDQIIAYARPVRDSGELIFIVVNLDPHHIQEADFEIPLWEWNLPDHESLHVDDLIHEGVTFIWTGKLQRVRLDPSVLPYAIWRFRPVNEGAA